MSAKRKSLKLFPEAKLTQPSGAWYPSANHFNVLKGHPKWIDGHYEITAIALAAQEYGLTFPLRLRKESAEFRSVISADASQVIGVHVRLGDYKTWKGGRHILNAEYYRQALYALGESPRSAKVRIFSDDMEGARHLLQEVGVPSQNMQFSTLLDPAEDLVHLSMFERKVLSHSTFAWWAGFFGNGTGCVIPYPYATMKPLEGWIPVTY